uniref:MIF4G domain-containing protein n=1 Tax=Oryza nivara TaxID=4536 RepID=A0A0E0H3B4_ORYNI
MGEKENENRKENDEEADHSKKDDKMEQYKELEGSRSWGNGEVEEGEGYSTRSQAGLQVAAAIRPAAEASRHLAVHICQLEGTTYVRPKNRDDKKKSRKHISRENDAVRNGDLERAKARVTEGANLDTLIQKLPGCSSRDLIDQLTVEFCYLNSKANRKKLAWALFNVPRTSLELLTYYSRLVATLSTYMKDLPSITLSMLEDEFNFLINKKASLDDFSHHNIDVACNLLETCGCFLYHLQETTIHMSNMLEILWRLKNVKNLDPCHNTLVENAYYLCKPPERSTRVSKYIRKLLFMVLTSQALTMCFISYRSYLGLSPSSSDCSTAGLSHYHEDFAVAVVDEVLEEIRVGLELNDYSMQQQRLAHMQFFGELYNYEHIGSSIIFQTLYLIIVFGHKTPEPLGYKFNISGEELDLFAHLGSNMTRYSSMEELSVALIELEANGYVASAEKCGNEWHSGSKEQTKQSDYVSFDANHKSSRDRIDENGNDNEELAVRAIQMEASIRMDMKTLIFQAKGDPMEDLRRMTMAMITCLLVLMMKKFLR